MLRRMRGLAGLAVVLACAGPAAAQPEAFLLWGGVSGCYLGCGGTILRVATQPPAVLSSVVDSAGEFLKSPYLTPDGRFLVWFTEVWAGVQPARVALRDTTTGTTTTIDVPGAGGMLGNPARPEVFLFDAAGALALGPAGLRRFAGPSCAGAYPISASADGRRLLSFCAGDGTPTRLNQTLLFDTEAGQVVTTLPPWSYAALSRDGREVYAVDYVSGALHLQRRLAATGAVLVDVAIPAPFPGAVPNVSGIVVDHRANRVILTGSVIRVFDGTSLDLLRSRNVLLFGQVVSVAEVAVDEAESLIYLTVSAITEGGNSRSYEVYDTAALDLRAYVPFVPGGSFVPIPKPLPPTALTAAVTGADVGLSWSPGGGVTAVTRYVLEVGSAPGLTDIVTGLDLGLQMSLAASGVPPGTYYVRVRAGNYSGLGAPSNEVAVQVP